MKTSGYFLSSEIRTENLTNKSLNCYRYLRLIHGFLSNLTTHYNMWHAVAQLDEALRYNLEGRGFDSRTMALWSSQALREMNIKYISLGIKAAVAYGRQPYHLHAPIVWKSGILKLMGPPGPVMGPYRDYLTFITWLLKFLFIFQGRKRKVQRLGAQTHISTLTFCRGLASNKYHHHVHTIP